MVLTAGFDPETFIGTAYAGLNPFGSRVQGWDTFVRLHDEALVSEFAKGEGPGWMFATADNHRRRNIDLIEHNGEVRGLAIDLDEGIPDFAPIEGVLNRLEAKRISYLAQWRKTPSTYKVHIAIPYANAYPVVDPGSVRNFQSEITRQLLGNDIAYDPATTKVAGLLFAMTPRPGIEVDIHQRVYLGDAIDLGGMYPVWTQGESPKKRSRAEAKEETGILLPHLEVFGWIESKGAWDIKCPVDHQDDYESKTYLYPSGHISCMAGKCQQKQLSWFVSHLPPEAQREIESVLTTPLKVELVRNQDGKVSVEEAGFAILESLKKTKPVVNAATVIQVSTGAGKTRHAAAHLNQYSMPFEDGVGLSSILALPTNALLREVESRIEIPHIRRTGVLAVLNDDGSFACKKHEIAKTVASSVHRLLCGHCEYKEDCPAREGATTGEGSLTLTNHTLMPATASHMHDRGRHPLLVWDESPQWVDSAQLEYSDLDWLIEEFDREARPKSVMDGILNTRLFSDRYRAAVRPLVECVRWAKAHKPYGTHDAATLIQEWSKQPYHQMMIARAREVHQMPAEDVVTDVVSAFRRAYLLNAVETGFDTMRKETQTRVLRSEALMTTLGILSGGQGILVLSKYSVAVAALTTNGELFKNRGGVVLDATANLAELRALRPDLTSVVLRVRDAGDTQRWLRHCGGLGRKTLAHRRDGLEAAVKHAKANTPGDKVVVFTYKDHVDVVAKVWPEAAVGYFGNTRGYDHYFQEGYDTFVTIGDPIANLAALALQWRVLTGKDPEDADPAWTKYVAASAESELAQAHGRARNPQKKLGEGGRFHAHYGRKVPAGWDAETTKVEAVDLTAEIA